MNRIEKRIERGIRKSRVSGTTDLPGIILFKVIILTILTAMAFPANVFAQKNNIRFEHLGLEHGLSQVSINCMLQDSQGFIWFGTEDGLNKYDGYKFTVYRHIPDDRASLIDNYILSIFEDSDSNLWIGTRNGGLNKFDRSAETFTHYQNQADNPHSISHNSVRSIFEDSGGNLWIGTGGGLNKFDRSAETFTRYQNQADNPHSLSHNSVRSIFEDAGGNLWIGAGGGELNKFDRSAETFTRYQNQADDPHSSSQYFDIPIFEDSGGNLWIGTGEGLNKFDRKSETFFCYQNKVDDPHSISHNIVISIFEDSGRNLWIGTGGGGLNKFDRSAETFTRYQNQADNPHSLNHNVVISLFEDSGGNLWIGTGGGLNKFDRKSETFTHHQNRADSPHSLNHNMVWSIFKDSGGNLWIGTEGGLNKLAEKAKKFIHYQNQADNPHSLSHNSVMSIFEDSGGNLWIGTYGGGINKLDRKTEKFTRFQNQADNPHSISNNFIRSILEDSCGNLWIGTEGGGLNKLDRKTKKFTPFQNQADKPYSLSHNWVRSIFEDSGGNLWVGTFGGLNKFDRKTEKFTRFQNQADNPHSISHNRVISIFEDSGCNLWIGTSGGLNKFDKMEGTFAYFREKDGLPNDVVYGILEDDKGNLWISTNKGISKFNPKQGTFTNYDEKDGLQSNEFNGGAYHKDKSGRIYFGGINGFNEFYPDQIQDNTYIPPVVITDFLLFNKPVSVARHVSKDEGRPKPGKSPKSRRFELEQHINFTREITLDYRDYIFALEFSALNYRQPEKNQFAYKLEGFDKDWIETDYKNRRATYTNIPHGEYIFHVKASNDDRVWNERGASIKITILPPFWKTWWFQSLVLLFILWIVYFLFRLRIKHISEEKFRTVAEQSVVGICIIQDNAIKYANPKLLELFHYPRDRMIGLNPLELAIEDDHLTVTRNFENQKSNARDSTSFQFKGVTKNGNIIYLEAHGTLTQYKDKPALLETVIDISDRKKAEAELLKSVKLETVGILSAGIAHDFNNLLAIITGNLDMAKVSLEYPNPGSFIESAEKASNQAAELVKKFLTISEGGWIKRTKVTLPEILKDTMDSSPGLREIPCTISLPEDLKPLYGDGRQLRQVMVNLLLNAHEATCEMDEDKEIRISAQNIILPGDNRWSVSAGEYVKVSVKDNGEGIPEDALDKIFDPYFSTKERGAQKGMGMGLAVSYAIVQRHEGHITVTSTLQKGTTIDLYIPVYKKTG